MTSLGGAPPVNVAAAALGLDDEATSDGSSPIIKKSDHSTEAAKSEGGAAGGPAGAGAAVNATKKKKKRKKKKKNAQTAAKDQTVTLTKWDKQARAHKQITVPLVATEKDSSESLDESGSDEGILSYRKGGYHPVNLEESYHSRYRVVHKLGWGQFSTVWLSWDKLDECHVALKFVKSASHYMDAARDEIEIMTRLGDGSPHLCSLLNHFDIFGPMGKHAVLVFPVLGVNLWDLIDEYSPNGLRLHVVRKISCQLLQGVAYMHKKSVIHTDLKPENIALAQPSRTVMAIIAHAKEDMTEPERDYLEALLLKDLKIKIVDFGNGCWVDRHFTDDIQTTQYRAPEVIIRSRYGTACDMWSVACILFELATGEQLFHPKKGKNHGKDDDHIALITELLGHWPVDFAIGGKRSNEFFTPKGKLRKISKLEFWPLKNVLMEKYKVPESAASEAASFLAPMLLVRPKERARAEEMLGHAWLSAPDDAADVAAGAFIDRGEKSDEDATSEETEEDE